MFLVSSVLFTLNYVALATKQVPLMPVSAFILPRIDCHNMLFFIVVPKNFYGVFRNYQWRTCLILNPSSLLPALAYSWIHNKVQYIACLSYVRAVYQAGASHMSDGSSYFPARTLIFSADNSTLASPRINAKSFWGEFIFFCLTNHPGMYYQ